MLNAAKHLALQLAGAKVQSEILRCHENSRGRDRWTSAFAGVTPGCHSRDSGDPGFFMHRGEPKDHEVYALNDNPGPVFGHLII